MRSRAASDRPATAARRRSRRWASKSERGRLRRMSCGQQVSWSRERLSGVSMMRLGGPRHASGHPGGAWAGASRRVGGGVCRTRPV
eukprot:3709567-Prymnesium_polylepis.1